MPSHKSDIISMLKGNGYSVRESTIAGDEFRIFASPPGADAETVEVFMAKGTSTVCCGSGIIIGSDQRKKFFEQPEEKRKQLKERLEKLDAVRSLDFFEVSDDGENFAVTMRCEFEITDDVGDDFENCMNVINLAGHYVEEEIDGLF